MDATSSKSIPIYIPVAGVEEEYSSKGDGELDKTKANTVSFGSECRQGKSHYNYRKYTSLSATNCV
jgi:hypothetical protein